MQRKTKNFLLKFLLVSVRICKKNCKNVNIMKTQFFHKIIYDLKCHFYVMEKFCELAF